MNPNSPISLPAHRRGFTLIELLVVISIIAIIAGFAIAAIGPITKNKKISVARGELKQLEAALVNYQAKYGVYPPGNKNGNPLLSQLYYELSGTTKNTTDFVTLDGGATIPVASVTTAYGVGGFLNCTKGGGEDGTTAKNFLPSLTSKQIYYPVTNTSGGGNVPTTMIVTSVGGPDDNYMPLSASGLNPFRYTYPGTNNVGGYDLWVQLSINGKKYLVCNWSKAALVNTTYP